MPSFDIVSKFNIQEIDNAVNTVKRDISTRYDLKGTKAEIILNKTEKLITLNADNMMHLNAIRDMLENRSISRKISLKTYDFQDEKNTSGMMVRQDIKLREGISKDNATKLNKIVKTLKLKVQSQIQGQQLRITGKKIDDLQKVITALNQSNIDIPLSYINMKK